MRLYLSSFRLGTDPSAFVRMAGTGARVAVVANSIDALDAADRGERVARELDALTALGFQASEIDLRQVDDPEAAFSGVDALWVRGGNLFVLRHALAVSGADSVLVRMLRDDAIVYAGYSAGPCVLAPSLRGLEECDPIDDVARAYGAEARFDGLGVLPYAIVPHIDSPEHPESAMLEQVADAYRRDDTPHRLLRDGEALVVEGEETYVVGSR
ncbi:MAG: peptidase E [Actinomycetia bacterium]|nr:peptidase E [Actinomycetes bacterium]